MRFGGGFQRMELFQFLGDDLLECRGDRSFFDIDFLSGQVLELLDRFVSVLRPTDWRGEKSDDLKAGLFVNGVRDAGSW